MLLLRKWLSQLLFPSVSPIWLAAARIATGLYASVFMVSQGALIVHNAGGAPETFAAVGLAHLLQNGPLLWPVSGKRFWGLNLDRWRGRRPAIDSMQSVAAAPNHC